MISMDTRCFTICIRCNHPNHVLEIKNGYDPPFRRVVSGENYYCVKCRATCVLVVSVHANGQTQTAYLDLRCAFRPMLQIRFTFLSEPKTQTFSLVDKTYLTPIKKASLFFTEREA